MEPNRPESIPGYVHPEKDVYSRQGIYKTFTEGNRKKKFGKTSVGKQYANNGELEDDTCPMCDNQAVITCHCGYSDKKCENGHIWYTDRDGIVKTGDPHK